MAHMVMGRIYISWEEGSDSMLYLYSIQINIHFYIQIILLLIHIQFK